jgi:ATP-dependent helicase/DNAse subunit B
MVQDAKIKENEILGILKKEQIDVSSYRIIPASLEDVFIASLNV